MTSNRIEPHGARREILRGICAALWGSARPLPCVVLAVLSLVFFGCGGPDVELPSFSVQVKLSPAAQKKLRATGHPIRIIVDLGGDGTPIEGEHWEPFWPVYFGRWERTLAGAGVVTFSGMRVPKADMERLESQDFWVNITAGTPGKFGGKNVLDTETITLRISELTGKTTVVTLELADGV